MIRTESCYVTNQMVNKGYEDCGVEKYEFSAYLDSRTSDVCRNLNGKKFKLSEAKVGVNMPPMHPWCRATTLAVIDEELIKEPEDLEEELEEVSKEPELENESNQEPEPVQQSSFMDKKAIAKASDSDIIKLSKEELGAIQRYKSSESYMINDALQRVKDVTNLSLEQQQFVKLLDSALSKIKTYEGNLVRTVNFSSWPDCVDRTNRFLKEFEPEKTVKIKQYWSASKELGYDEEAGIRIYIQDSKRGRDISKIGVNEEEVLYERKCEYFVVAKVYHDGIWNILLREV